MYKCRRHRRLYSIRKIIVPIWSLSKGKIRETLYQILTYTRYVWIQKLIVNFISFSHSQEKKRESNDFTFAFSCFEHSAFLSLIFTSFASRWYFADSSIYMCARFVTYIYHEWSNRSYHLTFARPILFRREKRDKTRLSKKKHPPLDVIAFELIFLFFFQRSRWTSIS